MTARTLLGFDGLAGRNFDFFDDTTDGSDDGNLHLHRFHDDDDIVFLDAVANLFFYFKNFTHHRGFNRCCQASSPLFAHAVFDQRQRAPTVAAI